MNTLIPVVLVSSVLFTIVNSAALPAQYAACKRKDGNFKDCLKKSVQTIITQLKNPIPELGLSSLEPLNATKFNIHLGHHIANMNDKIDSLSLSGLTSAVLSDFDLDLGAKSLRLVANLKNVKMDMIFQLSGEVYTDKFDFKAVGTFTLGDVVFDLTAKLEEFDKDGQKYYKVAEHKFSWKIDDISKTSFVFTSDQKDQVKNFEKLEKEHYQEMFKDGQDGFEILTGKLLAHQIDLAFGTASISELFGDA